MEVVFARIMPFSGWKVSKSERDKACPPTVSAISLALSTKNKKEHSKTKNIKSHDDQSIYIHIYKQEYEYLDFLRTGKLS